MENKTEQQQEQHTQTPLQVWTNFWIIVSCLIVIGYMTFRTFNYLELKLERKVEVVK
jgi:hypothetical protein